MKKKIKENKRERELRRQRREEEEDQDAMREAEVSDEDEEGEDEEEDDEEEEDDVDNSEAEDGDEAWAGKEELAADGIVSDPKPVTTTTAPGKGNRGEKAKLQDRFLWKWRRRPLKGLDAAGEDDAFLKHATRHGMSPQAIFDSGLLKTGSKDTFAQVFYRIRSLKGTGVDMEPRTKEAAWRAVKPRGSRTPKEQEMDTLIAAIERGDSAAQIVAANIVTLHTNTERAIKHRWDTWLRNGKQLPRVH